MIKVGGADVEYLRFSAGEDHVKLTNIRKSVTIWWQFEDVLELFKIAMIVDVLNRNGSEVAIEIPYLPFARQDRATTKEQPFSLEVFCKILSQMNFKYILVCDVHSGVFVDIMKQLNPSVEIIEMNQLECFYQTTIFVPNQLKSIDVVIAPDKGSVEKAQRIADFLDVPLIQATKVRDPLTGKLSAPTIDFGDLKPKHALIPDDILDYGGTFIQLANEIKKQFPEIKLDLYVTHGIFAGGIEKFKNLFEKIYCFNIMNEEITSGDLVNLSRLP